MESRSEDIRIRFIRREYLKTLLGNAKSFQFLSYRDYQRYYTVDWVIFIPIILINSFSAVFSNSNEIPYMSLVNSILSCITIFLVGVQKLTNSETYKQQYDKMQKEWADISNYIEDKLTISKHTGIRQNVFDSIRAKYNRVRDNNLTFSQKSMNDLLKASADSNINIPGFMKLVEYTTPEASEAEYREHVDVDLHSVGDVSIELGSDIEESLEPSPRVARRRAIVNSATRYLNDDAAESDDDEL